MTGSHYRMADVGGKAVTRRRAVATGRIRVGGEVFARLQRGPLPKGDPLRLAEVAGIMAAKRTPDLLPLCHPLTLDHVAVVCRPDASEQAVEVFAAVVTSARTGVEMEALAAVNAALLTIWDLAKPALAIDGIRLLLKEGGKSGRWEHPDGLPPLPQGIADAPIP
jgi:molybdenum cofactor biosynthesis protein MoaC